jgi:uncharacterized RDD family membrane protein YckC
MIENEIIDAEEAYIPQYHIAGKGKRLLNLIIDTLVILLLTSKNIFITNLLIKLSGVLGFEYYMDSDGLKWGCQIMIGLLYYFLMEVSLQRTVGKILTRTIVIDKDGYSPKPNQILKRTWTRLLIPEMLTFLWGSNFHDAFSNTLVSEIAEF